MYSSTHLEDVPAADTFSVEDTVVVRSAGTQSVLIDITFEVKFVKSTFLRPIIENPTNSEMKKWLQAFYDHVYQTCVKHREKVDKNADKAESNKDDDDGSSSVVIKQEAEPDPKLLQNLEELQAMLAKLEQKQQSQQTVVVSLLAVIMLLLLVVLFLLYSTNIRLQALEKST